MIESSRTLNPQTNSQKSKKVYTHEVVEQIDQSGVTTYYLPCYVRFVLKEINGVDTSGMEANITGTLLFSFYYGKLDPEIVNLFVGPESQKNILLEFNQEEAIELQEQKGIVLKEEESKNLVHFIIRQTFRTKLDGNVFLTPFDTLYMDLSVIVQTVHVKHNGAKYHIKFNCMDNEEVELLSLGEQLSFGYYRIVTNNIQTTYSDSRANPYKTSIFDNPSKGVKKSLYKSYKENKEVSCYQYTHFRIPIYKYPGLSILTIFIPIWILGLIGLGVFFQEQGFGARLATVAVLILAFVAFLPTINGSIPQSPNIKLVDILILLQITSTILLLVESFQIKDVEGFVFEWQKSNYFLISLAFNATTVAVVTFLFIIHKLFWERNYQQYVQREKNKFQDRRGWENVDCDEKFMEYARTHKMKNL